MQHIIQPTKHVSKIEQRVMRRVAIVRASRAVLSGEALALVIAIAALYGLGREVWVARVFQNAPRFALSTAQFSAAAHFWLAAFLDTRTIVQLLIAAATASFLVLVWSALNAMRRAPILSATRLTA